MIPKDLLQQPYRQDDPTSDYFIFRDWAALVGALFALVLLTSCASPIVASPSICPPVVVYTPAEQDRLADETAQLAEGSMLLRAITDYGRERAMLRACRG